MIDACILGAGPAGLSAALWLRNLGLQAAIFDCSPQPGGAQRLNFLTNDWVLGVSGLTGPQLVDRFVTHVQSLAIPFEMSAQPVGLRGLARGFVIDFDQRGVRRSVETRTLLVATGTRYRGPEVLAAADGFDRLPQSAIAFGPYAFSDLDSRRGQRILIVGGGDNAFENARRLLGTAAALTIVVRSRPRAQANMVSALHAAQVAGACDILTGASVEAIRAQSAGLQVTVGGAAGKRVVECDRIHVLAGYDPNTAFLPPLLTGGGLPSVVLDEDGYIVVDVRLATSSPGIYAAGDVCNRLFPSVVSAIGQGASAAKAIEADLAPTP